MSRGTLDPAWCIKISPTGLSPCFAGFPKTVRLSKLNQLCSPQPPNACIWVWPLSLSLAATQEIDVSFSSSPYLDVPQLVDTGFQVLFHSPPGVLFTFPSQYYTLSVTE